MPPQAPLGWDSFSGYSEISDLGSLQEGWPRVLKTIPQLECVWCFSYESYMDSTCVLPKTHRLKLNAHVILWGSGPPGGDQVLTGGGGGLLNGIRALIRKGQRKRELVSHHVGTQQEACCLQLRRELSSDPAGSLISNFQPPEL